eukprot:gnl/Spiro4/1100_TR577_c0_g1_i1.p1 gnl/Spiro4/1100_TR577_c0_g1~~gnl/Spiro4/1100_TR577_c0_g1_i1.p1  ORF type:complete len:258 (-),score=25.26 gnl/Spiro4/1100_TR577_c0_g1_i1:50-793(-)
MGSVVNRYVFQPPPRSYPHSDLLIMLEKPKGTVPAYYLRCPGAYFTILYCHGNAEDIGMCQPLLVRMRDLLQVNVFAFEYTGYGLSTGGARPKERAVCNDVVAAYTYIVEQLFVPVERLVVFGRSLGTGVACFLCSMLPVRALILQSPLLSVFRVGIRMTLPGDLFPNIKRIKKIRVPVFVIHGCDDDVIPISHGQTLHKLAADSRDPWWIRGCGHNDIEEKTGDEFFQRIARFLTQVRGTPFIDAG